MQVVGFSQIFDCSDNNAYYFLQNAFVIIYSD